MEDENTIIEDRNAITEEIDRIMGLLPRLSEVDLEDEDYLRKLGFKSIDDYNFVKLISDRFDSFMSFVEQWEGLEERKPNIQRIFVYMEVLRNRGLIQ